MDVALRSTGYVLNLQTKALLASVSVAHVWLGISAKVVMMLLSCMGVMPNDYANRLQIRELNQHVDVMHRREAKLLERVETLTEERQHESRDKARAIRKLQKARSQSESLAASLEDLKSQPISEVNPSRAGQTSRNDNIVGHVLLWSAVAAAFLNSGSLPSLECKLLTAILVPAVVVWVMPGDVSHGGKRLLITQCVSCCVLGFLLNHRLS